MSADAKKTLVIRNGTLIDGSGKAAARNDAIVIEGNKIKSVGALPPDVILEDRRNVEMIDAAGQWIMPAELVASIALAVATIVVATVVSTGIARANVADGVIGHEGSVFGLALLLGLIFIGMSGLSFLPYGKPKKR